MDIKKIIKEELEGWEWAEDVNVPEWTEENILMYLEVEGDIPFTVGDEEQNSQIFYATLNKLDEKYLQDIKPSDEIVVYWGWEITRANTNTIKDDVERRASCDMFTSYTIEGISKFFREEESWVVLL